MNVQWRQIHSHFRQSLQGLTKLDRELFHQTIEVPSIVLPVENLQLDHCRKYLFQQPKFNHIRDLQPISTTHKRILFDPDRIRTKNDLQRIFPTKKNEIEETFRFTTIHLTYPNFTIDQIIKAVLPAGLTDEYSVNTGSSFSIIGHIAHFNLKDRVLPYKFLIGELKNKTRRKFNIIRLLQLKLFWIKFRESKLC